MKYMADGNDLTSIANAIRAKGVTGSLEFPDDFVNGIGSITTGTDVSDTTAAAGDVLSGKYFYTAAGVKTQGSIASKSSSDMTASTLTVTAPAGHYASDGVKTLSDANLVAGNIKKDVAIFGVTGSYEGSGGSAMDGDVIFIDYDGTVVDAKTKVEINAMTSDSDLPANPTHTGLTAQGWNWTVAQLKAQLTAMPDQKVVVGQMYVTTSGATEIDVVMKAEYLNPILTIAVNGTISVDWGDGTTPDSLTGDSTTTRLEQSHTYANAGNYTIKISKTSGTAYAFYSSAVYSVLRKNTNQNENKIYTNTIRHIRIGNDAIIDSSAFAYCYSLISVSIPNTVTSIGASSFNYCYSLRSITIPSSVTIIDTYTFYYCCSLKNIALPSGLTNGIGSRAFYYCVSLPEITIPSSMTQISNNAFQYCTNMGKITIPGNITSISDYAFQYSYCIKSITIQNGITSIGVSSFANCPMFTSITIPNSVTTIGGNAFSGCNCLSNINIPSEVTNIGDSVFANCYSLAECHVEPATPPTIGTTIFNNASSDLVIYVPRGKLSTYQSAAGWSDYANKMQEEPD